MPKEYLEEDAVFGAYRKVEKNYPWIIRWYGNIMQEVGGWIMDQGIKYGDMFEYVGRSNNEPTD